MNLTIGMDHLGRCFRRTLGAAAGRSGSGSEGVNPNNSDLHKTYDNLTVAYSTEVRSLIANGQEIFLKIRFFAKKMSVLSCHGIGRNPLTGFIEFHCWPD